MKNILKLILKFLTTCVIISIFSLLVALISREASIAEWIFGAVGIYSLIISVKLFVIHVILFLI
jgi:hypothetical protein